MKNIIIIFLLLFNSNLFSQDHIENTIIVKLKSSGSSAFQKGNTLDKFITNAVGEYEYKKLIDNRLLNNFNKNHQNTFLSFQNNNSLSQIYQINFDADIDIQIICRKLNSFPEIEYAEPKFKRSINYIPNDSLINEQYYLTNTATYKTWQYLDSIGQLQEYIDKDILVGIVDTGIDRDHIELQETIFINQGENGLDANGNDKSSNGIDDDENGFVDDVHGWDFVSDSTEKGYDNDPSPGHPHGTHVGGVISAKHNNVAGIAGIGINMKLLPVKIGSDSQFSTSVNNSYEGILYAGLMGCDVINCSWGGSGYSQAEQEIINAVTNMGSLIVAAAGNDSEFMAQYPASYDNVISVAATQYTNKNATFTNMHGSVDVSAPGYQIISTIPLNGYDAWNGTSMATPIAAAIAGWMMKRFPDNDPVTIGEKLKSSTEKIEFLDNYYPGMMGQGLVNLFNVINDSSFYSIDVKETQLLNLSGKRFYRAGDEIALSINLQNTLDPQTGVSIMGFEANGYYIDYTDGISALGDFQNNEEKQFNDILKFRIIDEYSFDKVINPVVSISSNEGYRTYHALSITINPTYNIFDLNNIEATFNSKGNIGYNDYSSNVQGTGVRYKGSTSHLFEGAFMAAIPGKVNDVARIRSSQKKDFKFDRIISLDSTNNKYEGSAEFYNKVDSNYIGLYMSQKIIQPNSNELQNVVYIYYDIANNSGEYIDSLFAGIFMDWDIGTSGEGNLAYFDYSKSAGIAKNAVNDSLPYCSMVLLNHQDKINFYAINNPGGDTTTFSIYNGFTDSEKWRAISNGIARDQSDTLDASYVLSAGPISMREKDTIRLAFAMVLADNEDELNQSIESARIEATNYFELNEIVNIQSKTSILEIFPNPIQNGTQTVDILNVGESNKYNLTIYDNTGRTIFRIFEDKVLFKGINRMEINLNGLSDGIYYLSLSDKSGIIDTKIITKVE